jgi:hypothetical protein
LAPGMQPTLRSLEQTNQKLQLRLVEPRGPGNPPRVLLFQRVTLQSFALKLATQPA